ncbi:MAG TPA: NADPH dehydrogenase NamA [Bacteroidales bacterium]|jgi:2,4-dienoyl-CoA reductase-like NADH-dependent reductase (Old Yellow Enzyme family)|nr:NADPH dehydrogenase NamA [Bacteroidales bacterium]
MSKLFTPLTIKNVTLKNRIAMSPMCQYSAKDGFSNDWHLIHLGSRAVGGAGLIIFEATAVTPEGRITPGDLGLWDDGQVEGLSRIVRFIHQNGAHAAIQLAHAGRKASCAVPWQGGRQLGLNNGGWNTVAPSPIPFMPGDRTPEALTREGIRKIISGFRSAAKRSRSAGFDIIEIHCAHGYLLHEFLSPLSNHRDDDYGGSFENRAGLLLQVTDAIKSEWPSEHPLFVRISATDWAENGWTPDDSLKLSFMLKEKNVDLVDCSSGGNVHDARIPFGPGYQVPFSEMVRKSGVLTGTVGLITSAAQAEAILQENKADLVLFGRELLRNPYFPLQAAKQLESETNWPVQYLRAK